MPKNANKVVIGAKVESTQGTLVSLSATDYLLAERESTIAEVAEIIKRNPRRSSIDSLTHLIGKKSVNITIKTEIKGSGVAGTAYAPLGALLQCCGYVETASATGVTGVPVTAAGTGYASSFPVTFTGGGGSGALAFGISNAAGAIQQIVMLNAGSGYSTPPTAVITAGGGSGGTVGTVTTGGAVTYAPTSNPATNFTTPSKSCSVEVYMDGHRHSIAGCVGTVVEAYELEQVCYITFNLQGKYTAVTDAAIPSTTYLSQVPVLADNVNFRCMDFASVATKLTIDTKNTIAQRPDLNTAGGIVAFMVTDRAPEGSVDPEMEAVATHDFHAKLNAGTEGVTCLKLGTTAGNIVWSVCPKTQYNPFKYGERSGIMTLDVPLQFNQYLGDDWHSLIFY